MTEHEVARTLVKSAPELWEVCSDPDSLARHLEAFGEIRITRVEPETTVAWEGERASGTVRIEPSGWGTRVTLTATALAEPPRPDEPPVSVQPAPDASSTPEEAEAALGIEEPPATGETEEAAEPPATGEAEETAEPAADTARPPRPGFFRRLGGLLFRSLVTPMELPEEAFAGPPDGADEDPQAAAGPEPEAAVRPEPEAEVVPVLEPLPEPDPASVLAAVLDKLGSDHHRPFSRS